MKKLLLSCMLLPVGFSMAQVVPNPWFENWQVKATNIPKNWNVYGGYGKSTGKSGGNSMRLSNSSSSGSATYAYQASFDTSLALFGPAFAFTGTPDSMRITYRASLGADTTYFQVSFLKSGEPSPLTYDEFQLTNTPSGNWVTKTFPISYVSLTDSLDADSGWIFIKSADDIFGPYSSGFIEIDDVTFVFKNGTSGTPIPNGDLNGWDSYSLEYPTQWITSSAFLEQSGVPNSNSSKTTDFHTGNYALKLQGIAVPTLFGLTDTFPGMAITSRQGSNASVEDVDVHTPAFKVTQRFQSIRGFMKSGLQGADRVMVLVNFFDADSIVGSALLSDPNSHSAWFEFSEDIAWDSTFSGTPDSATIQLLVCDTLMESVGSLASWAIFDDLHLDNYSSGLYGNKMNALRARAYPNPSDGQVNVAFKKEMAGDVTISISALNGQVLSEKTIFSSVGVTTIPLDITSFSNGIYLITLHSAEGVYTQKIVKK